MQSNRLMLIIAVVAGVMATVLAFTYIRSATSALESPQTEAVVSVLFVTRDLPANHEINPETDVRAQDVGATSAEAVARGAVATVTHDPYALGWQVGEAVSRILNGAKPRDVAIRRASATFAILNKQAAEDSGIELQAALLDRAGIVHE